jgi:hypothetical protein
LANKKASLPRKSSAMPALSSIKIKYVTPYASSIRDKRVFNEDEGQIYARQKNVLKLTDVKIILKLLSEKNFL